MTKFNVTIKQRGLWQLGVGLILLISLMLSVSQAKPTQQTTLSGQVVDPFGNPVEGATLFARGSERVYRAVTDAQGRWSLAAVAADSYDLYAVTADSGSWEAALTAQAEGIFALAPEDNVIVDGDFESDDVWTAWERFNGTVTLTSESLGGQHAARLGDSTGELITCSQNQADGRLWSIRQTIDIPTENPVLSFAQRIQTSQTEFDYAWLEVVLMIDGQPNYLVAWGETWQESAWTQRGFDLTAWHGQTATLIVQAVNCGDATFTVDVDRIAVGNWVPKTEILPTITPTPAPTSDVLLGTPTPVHTPSNPNAEFVGQARQLTACENQGKHHLFIYVEDASGAGIADVEVRVSWPDGEAILLTGTKGEHAGLVDFPMFKGNYWVEILNADSDVVGPLTPDIPLNELCEENGNPVGNSLFHYSYEVTFTRQ